MGVLTIFVKVVLENPLETILFIVVPLIFGASSVFCYLFTMAMYSL